MAWIYLLLAGCCEAAFALSLDRTDGFKRWPWILSFLVSSILSFVLLALALRQIPVGSAYAVWTGVGAVLTATAGVLILSERLSIGRLVSLLLVVTGTIGLRLTTDLHE